MVRLQTPTHMITNAANSNLIEKGGLAGAIWNAGGPRMQAWLPAHGAVQTGQGTSSPAFDITTARYVAHMVGPDFRGLTQQQAQQRVPLLSDAYVNLLGQPGVVANPANPIYQAGNPLHGMAAPQGVQTLATALLSSAIFRGRAQNATELSLEAALVAFTTT